MRSPGSSARTYVYIYIYIWLAVLTFCAHRGLEVIDVVEVVADKQVEGYPSREAYKVVE